VSSGREVLRAAFRLVEATKRSRPAPCRTVAAATFPVWVRAWDPQLALAAKHSLHNDLYDE
jgi:hypothetical protein